MYSEQEPIRQDNVPLVQLSSKIVTIGCLDLDIKQSIYKHYFIMNRLNTEKRAQVLSALVEGVSINATCRMTGAAKHTVLNLLRDLGCAAAEYHHRNVRGLRVRRLQ